jgi:hypothetical protein
LDGQTVLNAHPDSDLWLRAPRGAREIRWSFGIFNNAWQKTGGRTDGVEFSVHGLLPGGQTRVVFQRTLDPVKRPGDRGPQSAVISFQAGPGELLHFTTRPGPSDSYDWAYWGPIEVK